MRAEEIIQYSSDKELDFYIIEENIYKQYFISAVFDVTVDNQPLNVIFKRGIIRMLGSYTHKDFDNILKELKRLHKNLSRIFEKIRDTRTQI